MGFSADFWGTPYPFDFCKYLILLGHYFHFALMPLILKWQFLFISF